MSQNFEFGQIYLIKDEAIMFPDNRKRKPNPNKVRPALILDVDEEFDHTNNAIVTIAPISTKLDYKRTFDIDIEKGKSNLHESSLVRVGCLQGVMKRDLGKCLGKVDDEIITKIYAALVIKFGMDFSED